MDYSPPSLTRSPASSPETFCSEASHLNYPSPMLLDQYKLGSVYGHTAACSSLSPNMAPESLNGPASSEWGGSAMMHPSSPHSGPGMLTAAADYTFAGYDAGLNTAYGHHDLYPRPPTTNAASGPISALPNLSPSLAGTPLSRSPDPGAAIDHTNNNSNSSSHNMRHQPYSYVHMDPRIKAETTPDYHANSTAVMEAAPQYTSPRLGTSPYVSRSSSAAGYLADMSLASWTKPDYPASLGSESGLYTHNHSQNHSQNPSPYSDSIRTHERRQPKAAARPVKKSRKLTSKEDANFQCDIKGCGKLFSRSYNYKAHLETHDDKREYPFPCTVSDCNKRFVRKTDLQRHHASVHMKEKNHKCDYCGRMFARKDTLRRHMEDGCPKRFDLGTLDLRSESYDMYSSAHARPLGGAAVHLPPPGTQLPPMTMAHGFGHITSADDVARR